MNVTRDHFEIALLRLRQARRAMRTFAELSADEASKVILDEAYLALVDELREFARCQYGLDADRRSEQPLSAHQSKGEEFTWDRRTAHQER